VTPRAKTQADDINFLLVNKQHQIDMHECLLRSYTNAEDSRKPLDGSCVGEIINMLLACMVLKNKLQKCYLKMNRTLRELW